MGDPKGARYALILGIGRPKKNPPVTVNGYGLIAHMTSKIYTAINFRHKKLYK